MTAVDLTDTAEGHTQSIALNEDVSPGEAHHPAPGFIIRATVDISPAETGTDRGGPACFHRLPVTADGHIVVGAGGEDLEWIPIGIGVGNGSTPVLRDVTPLSCNDEVFTDTRA